MINLDSGLRQEFEILEESVADNIISGSGRIAARRPFLEHPRPGRAQGWVIVMRSQGVLERPKDGHAHRVLAGPYEIGDVQFERRPEDKPRALATDFDFGHRTTPLPDSDDESLFPRIGNAQCEGLGIAHPARIKRPPVLRPGAKSQACCGDKPEALLRAFQAEFSQYINRLELGVNFKRRRLERDPVPSTLTEASDPENPEGFIEPPLAGVRLRLLSVGRNIVKVRTLDHEPERSRGDAGPDLKPEIGFEARIGRKFVQIEDVRFVLDCVVPRVALQAVVLKSPPLGLIEIEVLLRFLSNP